MRHATRCSAAAEATPVAELMWPQGHWTSGRGLKTANSNATIKPSVECQNALQQVTFNLSAGKHGIRSWLGEIGCWRGGVLGVGVLRLDRD